MRAVLALITLAIVPSVVFVVVDGAGPGDSSGDSQGVQPTRSHSSVKRRVVSVVIEREDGGSPIQVDVNACRGETAHDTGHRGYYNYVKRGGEPLQGGETIAFADNVKFYEGGRPSQVDFKLDTSVWGNMRPDVDDYRLVMTQSSSTESTGSAAAPHRSKGSKGSKRELTSPNTPRAASGGSPPPDAHEAKRRNVSYRRANMRGAASGAKPKASSRPGSPKAR